MTSMPYGGVINWSLPGGKSVHDFSVHHGYRHMVAWGVHLGSFAYYIEIQCARAKEMNAPKDAIYLSGADWEPVEQRTWSTFAELKANRTDIPGRDLVDRMEKYVQKIKRMESDRRK
jgi:hypothetical protein